MKKYLYLIMVASFLVACGGNDDGCDCPDCNNYVGDTESLEENEIENSQDSLGLKPGELCYSFSNSDSYCLDKADVKYTKEIDDGNIRIYTQWPAVDNQETDASSLFTVGKQFHLRQVEV